MSVCLGARRCGSSRLDFACWCGKILETAQGACVLGWEHSGEALILTHAQAKEACWRKKGVVVKSRMRAGTHGWAYMQLLSHHPGCLFVLLPS